MIYRAIQLIQIFLAHGRAGGRTKVIQEVLADLKIAQIRWRVKKPNSNKIQNMFCFPNKRNIGFSQPQFTSPGCWKRKCPGVKYIKKVPEKCLTEIYLWNKIKIECVHISEYCSMRQFDGGAMNTGRGILRWVAAYEIQNASSCQMFHMGGFLSW